MRWDVGFDRRAGVLPSNIRIHSGINVAAMLQIFSAALNFTAARGSFHSEKTRGKKEREKERNTSVRARTKENGDLTGRIGKLNRTAMQMR